MTGLVSVPVNGLRGKIGVPGDKSISHRALMIGGMAVGETTIRGLLLGDDVLRTATAMEAMGVTILRDSDDQWRVFGVGVGGLREPDNVLDLGNAGTGARLLMGLVGTHPITAQFTGDASLRSRPMGRIAEPLSQIGTQVIARNGDKMPLTVTGAKMPMPIEYVLPVPSAQVKSAVLLAGLNTPGKTSVVESRPSRDHTELMLRHFGANVSVVDEEEDRRVITVTGQPELEGREVNVPGDPSSAAFPLVAGLISQDAEITISNVGLNPLRIGLIETLREMGATIDVNNEREQAGEPVADLLVRSSKLNGVTVPPERAPSMIDEYPILAVAAATAEGVTLMQGLAELRVKESDRLAAIVDGLRACGVIVDVEGDDLIVTGSPGQLAGGARIESRMDHRIAMSFLVMGMAAKNAVEIDDAGHIGTSFPAFVELMNGLGAKIEETT
ncbi:MAG: 3-phosphoshikimate 1-carboxyvinyltransferase [Rhodospirillaceae bacterium]|nr:3-phosphoshikimate 1-carboxyvinyltransferase [Rhodospirillaceae bacterium]|tara:strand:- start:36513 stop:37841 length:1329 start_codon:yes stop_codon:yes gene_type:complete